MINEEFERKMTFIVEHQAQFTVDIEKLFAAQKQTEGIVSRIAELTLAEFTEVNAKIVMLTNSQIETDAKIKALTETQYLTDGKIAALVDSQIRTETTIAESQNRTDEAIRNLSATVERYLKRRNGGS